MCSSKREFPKDELDDSDKLKSCSSASLALDQRELHAKVSNLAEMFPDVAHARLEEAISSARGNIDTAIDLVIKQKIADDSSMSFADLVAVPNC